MCDISQHFSYLSVDSHNVNPQRWSIQTQHGRHSNSREGVAIFNPHSGKYQKEVKPRQRLYNITLWQIHNGREQHWLVNYWLLTVDHHSQCSVEILLSSVGLPCWRDHQLLVIECFGKMVPTIMSPTDLQYSWSQHTYDDALIGHHLPEIKMRKKIIHQYVITHTVSNTNSCCLCDLTKII